MWLYFLDFAKLSFLKETYANKGTKKKKKDLFIKINQRLADCLNIIEIKI